MSSFRAYFKKEVLEALRQYRYIILGFGIIFFAMATPIMLKLLPQILKGQANGMDISNLIKVTKSSCLQQYIKDLFQIANMFIAFSLSSIISEEISSQKLVLPFTKGTNPVEMVLAKFTHYALLIIIYVFIGFMINQNYASVLFTGIPVALSGALTSATLISIYFIFNLSLLMFLGSIFKKGVGAAIITLMISYLSPLLSNIEAIKTFNPYSLVSAANLFSFSDTYKALALTLVLTFAFIAGTGYRMNKMDII